MLALVNSAFTLVISAVLILIHVSANSSYGDTARQEAESESTRLPNVVFVLVDDMGWPDLGCYGHRFTRLQLSTDSRGKGFALPIFTPLLRSVRPHAQPFRLGSIRHAPGLPILYRDIFDRSKNSSCLPLSTTSIRKSARWDIYCVTLVIELGISGSGISETAQMSRLTLQGTK